MNRSERRLYLIRELLAERNEFGNAPEIPQGEMQQKNLLRGLMNVREPKQIGADFLKVQDEYLKGELSERNVTDVSALTPQKDGLYLWRGDITTLRCDAIVNAANSGMTGCYRPCHNCIDNCIHTYAGIQLRLECAAIMEKQGYAEPTGQAKITSAYNLPCKFVLHTVGPIVEGRLTQKHCNQLASCYRSCLELAEENGINSLAFCCISTGVFMFPNQKAAEIAVQTVETYKQETGSRMEVIFNVFTEEDERIYRELLGAN